MATREYETDYAAILLGQVGAISAESWEEKKDYYEKNDYTMDAIIGLSGSESAFEKYLRGTSGTKRVTAANDGDTLTERYVDEPQVGGNVALTIDIKLQEATEKALNDLVPSINNKKGGAAAVVIDISDGSVLAAASYPTYSAVTYNKDYEKLYQDKQKPLYNRAFLGTYAPGSTYKMCTATAGINAGVITPRTTYKCTGAMDYYGTIFHCWERSGHDREDLADAVRDSCNIYFYNVGINAGIDALTKTGPSPTAWARPPASNSASPPVSTPAPPSRRNWALPGIRATSSPPPSARATTSSPLFSWPTISPPSSTAAPTTRPIC